MPAFSDTKINFAYTTNADSLRAESAKIFKKEVEKNSKGKIRIELFDSTRLSSLGLKTSDTDLIESIMNNGPVDIVVSSAGNFSVYCDEAGLSALPYIMEDFDEADFFLESPLLKEIEACLEKSNIAVIGHFENGFRCITTTDKRIDCLKDLEGLHIRTPANKILIETMSALGCHPEPMDFGKLPGALKSGYFEGQENPIQTIFTQKLYEVQKYLAITNHCYDIMPLAIKKSLWEKLSENERKILKNAVKKAEEFHRVQLKKLTDDCLEKLKEAGMTITTPPLADFKAATQCVVEDFSALYGKKFSDLKKNGFKVPAENNTLTTDTVGGKTKGSGKN